MDLMGRGLGAQLAHASKSADFAVVIGKREADTGQVTLKNLHSGEQKMLDPVAALAEVKAYGIAERVRKAAAQYQCCGIF